MMEGAASDAEAPTRGVLRDPLLWVVLGLALAARLATLVALPDLALPDTDEYLEMAEAFRAGELASNVKYMPLFSLYAMAFGDGLGLKLADIVLSVATVGLVYALAERIFRWRGAALLAGLAAAIYPHFLFFSVARLSETLYLFLTCAAFLLFYRRAFFWGSVVLVLSILTRPTIDLLAPVLVAVFAMVVWHETWGRASRRVVVYLLVYAALMTPWWIHNYQKYDSFVRLNLGDGVVLYSGNNPMNTTGGGVSRSVTDRDMNLDQFDKYRDPEVRNAKMKEAAFDFIVDNPGRFVELAGLKFVRFWRLWPYADEYAKPHIIAASLLSYGPVLLLSLVFLWRFGHRCWRPMAPIYLFVAFLTLVHMATIGSIRYRLPVEPFLMITAGVAAAWLMEKVPAGQRLLQRFAGRRRDNDG